MKKFTNAENWDIYCIPQTKGEKQQAALLILFFSGAEWGEKKETATAPDAASNTVQAQKTSLKRLKQRQRADIPLSTKNPLERQKNGLKSGYVQSVEHLHRRTIFASSAGNHILVYTDTVLSDAGRPLTG